MIKPLPEYYCGMCNREFDDYQEMRKHRNSRHLDKLPRSEETFKNKLAGDK